MDDDGLNYEEAHEKTNQTYNYGSALYKAKRKKEAEIMGFLVVDITNNHNDFYIFKLRSDIEQATATLNKHSHSLVVNGFEDTLEYIFPLAFLKKRLVELTNLKTNRTHFCFGNG